MPYLSVVATSRNDDHGGDPLIRTQIFITTLARQCDKFKLTAELIIVDWNPVPNRPGLASVLNLPKETQYLSARVITVPTELHGRIKYSDKLPLFQMIAKNVGIRRAKGKFVLATNIDIVFSDELIHFIGKQNLDPMKQYRVDRYDIQSGLSKDLTLEETLEYAWNNPIRANRRYQPEELVKQLYGNQIFTRYCKPDLPIIQSNNDVKLIEDCGMWQIQPERHVEMSFLHTNACGDFTLLSRQGWDAIRGYPEFAAYSFNIDSIGMISAHYAGYTEVALLPPCVCFHIEHSAGSGWTPEWESKLFARLREAEILNPEWPVLIPLVNEMRKELKALEFNHAGWGMVDFNLPEQIMGDVNNLSIEIQKEVIDKAKSREVTAIQPKYDLDRLTLASERREFTDLGLANTRIERVQIFIPDDEGKYSETNSISQKALFPFSSKFIFKLEYYSYQFPLRLDPCESQGEIDVDLISIVEAKNNRLIMQIDQNNADKLIIAGTASVPITNKPNKISFTFNKKNGQSGLRIISSGNDPQIYLPPFSENIEFPISLIIEMKFVRHQ